VTKRAAQANSFLLTEIVFARLNIPMLALRPWALPAY